MTPEFWDEFDRRLNDRLRPLQDKIQSVVNWTQRQDRMLEIEVNHALKAYLEDQFKGYYTAFPTVFPKKLKDQNGLEITEFDGVLLLTNSSQVVSMMNSPSNISEVQARQLFTPGIVAMLVIIEAKQNLTAKKVQKKIEQKQRIEAFLRDLKHNPSAYPDYYQTIGLPYFEPEVGLYVGGQEIDESIKDILRNEVKKHPQYPSLMGWLELNGSRFSVADQQNDYGNGIRGGSKQRPKKR